MKGLVAFAAALALAPATQAATPIAGSGSLNDAPAIEPGEYSDTILPGEQLFYAVRVEAGQRLAVRAATTVEPEPFRRLVALVRFRPLGPLREPVEPDGEDDVRGAGSGAAWEAGPAAEDSRDPYLGAGTWYLAVHALWGAAGAPPRAEIPFTFSLEVAGAAGSTPTPAATATATAAPPVRASVDDAVDPAALGAVGMSGLLLGLLGGAVAGRRRR
jgi:hypothetical protein